MGGGIKFTISTESGAVYGDKLGAISIGGLILGGSGWGKPFLFPHSAVGE